MKIQTQTVQQTQPANQPNIHTQKATYPPLHKYTHPLSYLPPTVLSPLPKITFPPSTTAAPPSTFTTHQLLYLHFFSIHLSLSCSLFHNLSLFSIYLQSYFPTSIPGFLNSIPLTKKNVRRNGRKI